MKGKLNCLCHPDTKEIFFMAKVSDEDYRSAAAGRVDRVLHRQPRSTHHFAKRLPTATSGHSPFPTVFRMPPDCRSGF